MKNILIATFVFTQFNLYTQTIKNYRISDGLIDNNVLCVSIDNNDNVWFGTQNGVSKFDGTNWSSHSMSTDSGMVSNTISAIHAASNGDVWIGTDFGACIYNGSYWINYNTTNGMGDNRINYITESSDGRIWFGDYDGITIFDGTDFSVFNTSSGLPFGGVEHIRFDNNGDAWLSSGLGGIIKYDGISFSIYNKTDGLLSNVVRSIAIDQYNKKWVGTAVGVSVFNSSNNWVTNYTQMYLLPPPDTLNPVIDLDFDSQGLLWAGIYVDYLLDGGVAMYNGYSWVYFNVNDSIAGPVITDLAINSQDEVWVTTSTGISKISDTPATILESKNKPLHIYPNPSTNNITIELDKVDCKIYEIYDLYGKLIAKDNLENNIKNFSIDVSKFTGPIVIIVQDNSGNYYSVNAIISN